MGFLDSIKAKHKTNEEARGDKIVSLQVEYMGGYGEKKQAKGSLTFYQKQVEFKNPMLNKRLWFTLPSSEISEIAIEGL